MSSTALLSKYMGKVDLGRDLFLAVIVSEAYSFLSLMSSINEYKWSKCVSPLLSKRISCISETIFFRFLFLEQSGKTLKLSFTIFSIVS